MRTRAAMTCGALLVAAAACSSSSSDPSGGTSGTPPGQPRSFRKDVVPIFAQSCASNACHGDPNNTLGIYLRASEPDAVYAELQRESPEAKGVRFVVPGDPTSSYLFAKVNGDQGDVGDKCVMPGCGETMPPGTKIASSQRDTIRLWIAEGAANN